MYYVDTFGMGIYKVKKKEGGYKIGKRIIKPDKDILKVNLEGKIIKNYDSEEFVKDLMDGIKKLKQQSFII